jgi:hypothetical protein
MFAGFANLLADPSYIYKLSEIENYNFFEVICRAFLGLKGARN